ncbi:MAG: rhodanese-like domain-containing protein [Bacteroidales bacterium]|nr:rhodanese-like domain-containing protein [Bacteroidales bacterium]MCF8404857.1 rhodanese-like domain-containing protein [Bacteroidales bacterium]
MINKEILMALSILFCAGLFAQKPANYDEELKKMYNQTVPLITPSDLLVKLDKNPEIVLLDAREKNEYRVSHLARAICVGYNEFNINSLKNIPKDQAIVVYCSIGVRSEKIGEKLLEAGYTNVQNLYGGIFEWVYHDGIIVDKKGNPTIEVHAYDENWSKWLLKGEKIY